MIADSDPCLGIIKALEACHGLSRMILKGPRLGEYISPLDPRDNVKIST